MDTMWVVGVGHAVGLVNREHAMPGEEYFHASFSKRMVDEQIPIQVPADTFFNGKVGEGLLRVIEDNTKAARKALAYWTKVEKERDDGLSAMEAYYRKCAQEVARKSKSEDL